MPGVYDEKDLTFLDGSDGFEASELEFLDDAPEAAPGPPRTKISAMARSLGLGVPEREIPQPDRAAQGRRALETGAALATAPLTGGLGGGLTAAAIRAALAGTAGTAASLASESFDPTPQTTAAPDIGPDPDGVIAKVGRLLQGRSDAVDRALKTGAILGGTELAAGVSAAAAPILRRGAQGQSAKALGLIQGGLKKIGIDRARRIGQVALDQKIVSPLANAETMLRRAGRLSDDAGRALGNLRKVADSLDAGADAVGVASRVEKVLKDWRPGISEEAVLKKHLDDTVNDILVFADPKTGKLNASALAELKKFLGDRIFTNPMVTPQALTGRIKPRTNIARAQIQKAEEDFVKSTLSAKEFNDFIRIKRAYGDLQTAQSVLKDRIARDLGNNQLFGLSTQLGAITGATAGGGALGGAGAATGAAVTRILHQRGNQFSATALNALSKLAGSRIVDPASRAAALAILEMNRPSPEDRPAAQ